MPTKNARASSRTRSAGLVMSILHNVFVDGTRARRAEAQRIARVGEPVEQQLPPAQDHHVRLRQVRQAFIALPNEQRAALLFVAIEGLTYAKAASALGIPVGTLMSRITGPAALRIIEDGDLEASTRAAKGYHLRVVGGWDEPSR